MSLKGNAYRRGGALRTMSAMLITVLVLIAVTNSAKTNSVSTEFVPHRVVTAAACPDRHLC